MENNTATRTKSVIYADMDKLAKKAPDRKRLFGLKKLAYLKLELEIALIDLAANPEGWLETQRVPRLEKEISDLASTLKGGK